MKKISHQQVQSLLKTASTKIRELESDKVGLRVKVAEFEKRERAEKIAAEMEENGLHADLTRQEKVAHLLDQEKCPDLNVTEAAVKLASPQGELLGDLSENPGSGQNAFENYILTGEG